jgi:hypothetical protein
VFENRVLRRIFGPKRDEVTGEWRKLYNEELNILYSSPNIMRQTDFCLWGYDKDAVSVPPSNNPTSVTARITDATVQVEAGVLRWIRDETVYRWDTPSNCDRNLTI